MTQTDNGCETKNMRRFIVLGVFVIACVAIFGIWNVSGGLQEIEACKEKRFDALSSLFSGLAFAGLICTLIFQQLELTATRQLMARQAKANEDAANNALKAAKVAFLTARYQYLVPKWDKVGDAMFDKYGDAPWNVDKEWEWVNGEMERVTSMVEELTGIVSKEREVQAKP